MMINMKIENVKQTEVVIIDEIFMLSQKKFYQIKAVCRTKHDRRKYFCGLQVILCGDFYQLPPVPDDLHNDNGSFCFESEVFKNCVTHKVNLKKVMRQEDDLLVQSVRETALGNISDEVDKFLKSLERTMPADIETVHLFSRNIDATISVSLNKLNVNGLKGCVKSLQDDSVTDLFSDINQTHDIKRHLFSKYGMTRKCVVAEREQLPLVLGYVYLLNYRKDLCYLPKAVVSEFYNTESLPCLPDFSCCSNNQYMYIKKTTEPEAEGNDSDFDLEEIDFIEQNLMPDPELLVTVLPEYVDVEKLKTLNYIENPVTDIQKKINANNPDKNIEKSVKESEVKVNLLERLVADGDTADKTLQKIERKQNVRKALTYINKKSNELLNSQVFKAQKKDHTFSEIECDEDMQMLFPELFLMDLPDIVHALKREIVHKYLMVCHKQLLKDTKDKYNVMGKKAHRQEI
ncbi:LOW QUALITY PROTEIN: PIF1-like protein [Mya arenaria]|uniref:ATP-dependent DNA helicase n=1 Tax=Mya arenaria TaxID=6604 RepID=A0ABY7GCK3_MYAAR|nr:LOW QUALITY PROTEIN: PIF1-like protein [Mya arenaria]